MLRFAKTALLLLLYPVLYLRLPLTLKWFSASVAGLGAFVILLTNLRDMSSPDSPFAETGAPLLAYWGGYVAASGVVLLNNWIEQSYPRSVPLKAAPKASAIELDAIARAAAAKDLELATASLSERDRSAIVLGAYLADAWAVFEWFIPARKPAEARVLVRSAVDRATNRATVEASPAPAKHPHGVAYLMLRSIAASLAVAIVLTLIRMILDSQRTHEWPTGELVAPLLLKTWLVCLAYFALMLLRFRSMVPIRMPSGELLYVDRATARRL